MICREIYFITLNLIFNDTLNSILKNNSLVQKLQNDHNAHCLVEGFLPVPKVQPKTPKFGSIQQNKSGHQTQHWFQALALHNMQHRLTGVSYWCTALSV